MLDSLQVKFPLFGDQVAQLVLLLWWFRRAADDRKGNIKSYHSPVHRNESVTTVLRGIWYLRVAIIQVRGDKWQFRFMPS